MTNLTRMLIGAVILVLGLWVVIGEQIAGVSADAVVNGRLATLRSPIGGTVTMPPISLGWRVGIDETVATVTDPRVDSIRRDDLALEQARAQSEVRRVEAALVSLADAEAALRERADAYLGYRITEIEARLLEARHRLELLEGAAPPGADDLALSAAMDQDSPRTPLSPTDLPLSLSYARERVATLENELAAAEAQVFLGDGYNDSPATEQRRQQIEAERVELEIRLTALQDDSDAVSARLDREQARIWRRTEANITAPADGRFWEYLTENRTTIMPGDAVARVLVCGAPIVTASVSETVYNRLRPGDAATFRLNSDRTLYHGSVIRLGGAGAETFYRNLAIAPSERHLERYDVALYMPELASHPLTGCSVGHTGRAFFGTRPLDGLRRLFR
ncbi:MAG: HlyD family efflux transporter periplasmic adaptor subunit [Paracoccus sp. (in: a-proteobacteria)]|nr:HlyD family efflux transporter periplasmic adaptor subunit [Paracoccus sp. (in: a-proteobacteria)]